MGTVISNLKARFGVDTTDFKKGLKDGEKATDDFKNAGSEAISKFAEMFGVNMSAVSDAIGTMNKSLNFLGQSLAAAKQGGEAFAVGMKIVKFALVSTGIGALVALLGSVIAYFTKSGEGADKFAKILAQVKSVVNNVIERLAIFGKGLWEILSGKFKQGWEDMTGAFKGMGAEIKEDWKAAGALADAEDALEDREIALINSLEERRAKAAELRRQAKEEMDDQHKRLALLAEAEKITKSVYGDEISLERERLRIMKEKLAMQTSDPTDEQNRAIAEQEAKINSLIRAQADELRGMLKERNAATVALEKELSTFGSIKNLKMPEFFDKKMADNLKESLSGLHHTFIQLGKDMGAVFAVTGGVVIDMTKSINEAFANTAIAVGEFLGELVIGKAGFGDFAKMMAGQFAELMITIGKLCIQSALAIGALSQVLSNPMMWPAALAAGIALVAVGSAIKGSLQSAASGGGSATSLSGVGSYTFDSSKTKQQTINVKVTGTLEGSGSTLRAVLTNEERRRFVST